MTAERETKRETEWESTIRAQAHQWRAVLEDPSRTTADIEEFRSWIADDPRHAEMYAETEVFWRSLAALKRQPVPDRPLLRERWHSVAAFFGLRSCGDGDGDGDGRWQVAWLGAAMLVLASLATGYYVYTLPREHLITPTEIRTAKAELREVQLSDGTRVVLGGDSELTFIDTDAERRVTLLRGDAFFDVQRDTKRPFRVAVGSVLLSALGTAFDVQKAPEEVQVTVAEGRVRVARSPMPATSSLQPSSLQTSAPARAQAVILAPAERVVVRARDPSFGRVATVDAGSIGAWRDGILIYAQDTLANVVEDLNRYHPRTVALDPSLADLRLSGRFRTGNTEALIQTLRDALGLRVVDLGPLGLALKPIEGE